MKKLVSVFLALVMLLSASTSCVTGYAASKKYVGNVLASIQKQGGFVPGETAAVVGNCYGFISAVCERLYGVKYQEGLRSDGYTCKHNTGYYYTVKTYKTTSSDTAACANDIVNFFVNNAYPGDIVHYASLSGSTHTFMIQSIDDEKMQIFHSNYQTRTLSSAACHIDTIYWKSFRDNPTKTIYNDDNSMYSHNSLFYNKQKRGGLGMTINRFTDYEKYFYPKYEPPTLSVSRSSSTSILTKWTAVTGAKKYRVEYKRTSDSSYSTLTTSCTALKYDVKNLSIGTKYDFRVAAYAGGKWQEYSNVITKKVLPPTVSSVSFAPEHTGLRLKWAKKTDITGVRIYKSEENKCPDNPYKTLAATASDYLDTAVKAGKTYYYWVERYKTVSGKEYSTTSSAFSGVYTLKAPAISFVRNSADSLTFTFSGDAAISNFDYYLTSDSQPNSAATFSTDEKTLKLEDLTVGEHYTLHVRETSKLMNGPYASVTVQAAPRAVSNVTAAAEATGIRVSYEVLNEANGYFIYRANGGGYTYVGRADGKKTTSYLDTTVKYNTDYTYIVKAYTNSPEKTEIEGETGAASAATKVVIAAPEGLRATRKTPTSVTVKWKAAPLAQKYIVQYKIKGGSWITLTETKKTSRVIKKLELGAKYYFRVRGINAVGKGSYCTKISLKVLPPTPDKPMLSKKGRGIKVSYVPQSYASGYYIYRATSKNGKYKFIAEVKGHKKKSYTDYDVSRYKTYYYKLVCIKKKNGTIYKSAKSSAASFRLS